MKYLAVEFKIHELHDDFYMLVPNSVLLGTYNEEQQKFITNKKTYNSMLFYESFKTGMTCFGLVENEKDLIREYGNLPLSVLKKLYYNAICSNYYMIKKEGDIFNFVAVPFINIADMVDSIIIEEQLDELERINNLENIGSYVKNTNENSNFDLKELQNKLLQNIVGQDEAVKRITTRIAINFTSSNPRHKSHLLIAGPTGTGKTEIVTEICEHLNIPYIVVDATSITQEGYVGGNVNDLIIGLISACDGDVEKAKNGIIVIDEIDKKIQKSSSGSVSTKAVQESLLKLTGRKTIQVDIGPTSSKSILINFDTSNLTVIFMGAFEGILNKDEQKNLGFNSKSNPKKNYMELNDTDFIKFGLIPELVGRISCFVATKSLEVEDFVELIYKSKISALKLEQEYFLNDMNIPLEYNDEYVHEVAKKAHSLNIGARGINKVVSKSLENITHLALCGELNKQKIKKITLNASTVSDNTKYGIE